MKDSDKTKTIAGRVLHGLGWALASKFVGVIASLIANALLARMLGVADLGAFFVASSVVTVVAMFASFGMKQTIVRFVSDAVANELPGRAGGVLVKTLQIVALGVLVSDIIVFWKGQHFSNQVLNLAISPLGTFVFASWVTFLAFITPISETFRGLHELKIATLLDGPIVSSILAVALLVCWFTVGELTLDYVLLISSVCAFGTLLMGAALLFKKRHRLIGEGNISLRELISSATPMFITNIFIYTLSNIGLWIVAGAFGPKDAALFGAAWKLVNLVALPLLIVNMSIQPVLGELNATGDLKGLQSAVRGVATIAGVPALLVIVGMMLFSDRLLALVYGADYSSAAILMVALCVGQLANVWTGVCGQVLIFTGNQTELMRLTISTGVLSIALMVVAAAAWGVLGVAIASSTARILQNFLMWRKVYLLTGLKTHLTFDFSMMIDGYHSIKSSRTRHKRR